MLLVVESGSTKSDWVLVENKTVTNTFKTIGFNPFFHILDGFFSAILELLFFLQLGN